jgi:hypothetical protein
MDTSWTNSVVGLTERQLDVDQNADELLVAGSVLADDWTSDRVDGRQGRKDLHPNLSNDTKGA